MPATKLRDDGRIQRMISIAYILSTRSEIHIDELCERLEATREQVESDLNVLMFCGLPPYSPEQLFDISIEDEFVSMYFNDVFVAPLRLKNSEIVQVLIALERLKNNSGSEQENQLVDRTISKITQSQSSPIDVEIVHSPHDDIIQEAMKAGKELEILYLSLNSAKIDERIVVPKSIYNSASTAYLFAVEMENGIGKLFRIDRILQAHIPDESATHVEDNGNEVPAVIDSSKTQMFIDEPDGFVELIVEQPASWILDSIPQEVVSKEKSIYKFYTASPYFVARLLLSNFPHVKYSSGSISKEAIKAAVEAIQTQMQATKLA